MPIDSTQNLPLHTGSGVGDENPKLLAIAGSATGQSGPVADSSETLLALAGFAGGGQAPSLPALEGSATAVSGALGRSRGRLALGLAGSGTAFSGVMAHSAQTLPSASGSGGTPPASRAILPALVGDASGFVGTVGRSSSALPALTAEADGTVPILAASSAALPLPLAEGAALTGSVGASRATLAALVVAAEGYSGRVGTSAVALPVLVGVGTAHEAAVGMSVVTLPAIIGSATAAFPRGETYAAYALQTERQALTTYSNFPVAGLAAFNGTYLAAGPGGLFVLEGDDDDGALIAAAARLAVTDFGDPHLKRVDKLYLSYRSTGELTLTARIDDHDEHVYTVPAAHHPGLTAGKVALGRGARGAWWQWTLANRDGADFTLEHLAVEPMPLARKVG